MSLFNELKRRNVIRVGIAYVVASWLVAQVLQLVFETFGTPEWVMKTVLVMMAVGLPFVVFFSWAFELTPDGLKREKDVDRTQSITPRTGKKLDRLTTMVLALALAYFAFDKFVLDPSRDAEMVQAATQAVAEQTTSAAPVSGTPEQSIAVLPFVNMSDDKDYFADGLSEELLNLLVNIPGLKVAGRTSSFAFKGKNDDLRGIGDALGVANVLEGSVRRSGERLRITAQLVKVDDGFHIWSETYDRQMADIFDIQDDVAQAITAALKLHLAPVAPRPTNNVDAYALYMEASAGSKVLTAENFAFILGLLDQAIALDPEFAKAYEARATFYWWGSGWTMDSPTAQVLAYEAASKALELDPSLTLARTFKTTANPDSWSWIEEIEALEELVRTEPGNINGMDALTYDLIQAGYFNDAVAHAKRLRELEPLSVSAWWRAGEALSAAGRREEAQVAWARAVELGDGTSLSFLGADQLIAGNFDAGIAFYEKYYSWLGENPAEVRPLVENVRHPETGKAFLDAWIAEAVAGASNFEEIRLPYSWYLVFGYLDDYWAAIDSLGNPDGGWSNSDVLEQEGLVYRASGFARHPEYLKHAAATGLSDLWDTRGAPDHCQKVDGDWVCE